MPGRADIVSQTPEELARDVIKNTMHLNLGEELTVVIRKQGGSNPDLVNFTVYSTGIEKPTVDVNTNFEVRIVKTNP